jgi:hypothetical protein
MKRSTNTITNIYISQDIYRTHEESSTMHSPYFSLDAISTQRNKIQISSNEFQN